MRKSTSEESGKYNFVFLENYGEFSEKLLSFLNLNYCSALEKEWDAMSRLVNSRVVMAHDVNFFNWLFKKGGCLGVAREGEKWVAVYPAGKLRLQYGEQLHTIFHSALVCVAKEHRFRGLAQKIIKKTDNFIKKKYNSPVSGVGATGIKVPTILKNFNMCLSDRVKRPKEKIFSSRNFFLVDETSFFTKYSNDEGYVLCYPQVVMYKNNKEKWGVIASYFTTGSWNDLIFKACNDNFLKKFDRILIFENYERNADSLVEIGFEKFSSYNLYVDSPEKTPSCYLYYNLFLY